MYDLPNWADYIDRVATLTAAAATALFIGQTLILWWVGRRKDHRPHIPLMATISASIAFIAASALPVVNSVAITVAIATVFLLNGKLRTFFPIAIGMVVVLIGSRPLGAVLGGALVGVCSAIVTNLAFAWLLLAIVLRSCDMRTENQISGGPASSDG
jgi:hypothetical protein